jgi:hypothetical protein
LVSRAGTRVRHALSIRDETGSVSFAPLRLCVRISFTQRRKGARKEICRKLSGAAAAAIRAAHGGVEEARGIEQGDGAAFVFDAAADGGV